MTETVCVCVRDGKLKLICLWEACVCVYMGAHWELT